MSSRVLVSVALLILTALLAACAPIPSLPAPTAKTVIAEPVSSPAATPDSIATAVTSAITPTLAEPVSPTAAITETIPTPKVTSQAPLTATVTAGKPQEGGPPASGSTYRDDYAGFEVDYPAAWAVVDVTPQIKQQSQSYSITFMSWQPQEPGSQGIPQGGSKIDLNIVKGSAANPEAAVDSRRQEITQGDPGGQITFEEPWDLEGGLRGTHLTIRASGGEVIDELVTAINGNRIVLSGLGDADQFGQVAMTLRPLATAEETLTVPAPGTAQATGMPEAQAREQATAPATPIKTGGTTVVEAQPFAATVYTVRQGDTLAKIAARFGVSATAVLNANPQIANPDRIYVGQRITIPASGGTQSPAGTTRVNIYMTGIGGGGVGCGDQIVAVRRDVPRTAAPLTAALNLLFAQKSQYYGESGLYNALYQSNLRIGSITRSGTDWTIRLSGTLRLGGVCDSPRVKAQLEQTALQFSTVQRVRYFINGQTLETVLSAK